MALPALRDDALRSTQDGALVRVSLPWIRSLPVSSVRELVVRIDDEDRGPARVRLGDRSITVDDLAQEDAWWFLQDRLSVTVPGSVPGPSHRVEVSFVLAIPYLQAGPDGPLTLPFRTARELRPGELSGPTVSRDVA